MYAVKALGRVYLIGSTIGSLTLGIGMRWRESEVDIIERHPDPTYELQEMRRCVLSENSIKLLEDIGVTRSLLMQQLRPALKWKFVTMGSMETLREGDLYYGCSPMEPVYHCTEGTLKRFLRREYMRFGGSMSWESEAYDAFETNDGSNLWTLRKQYGPGAEAESIISFCNNSLFNKMLVVEDPERLVVLFDSREGICRDPSTELLALFGKAFDVMIALGRGIAVHCWRAEEGKGIAWRCVSKGRSDAAQLLQDVHPVIAQMMESSDNKVLKSVTIPATTPAIRDDAHHYRISVMGDALLPVDPFEWRGDNARTAIEDQSALCRALYGKKYHRGHVPQLLRSMEQDFLSRRANLLRRDLIDAEHFLAIHPELPKEEDDMPQMKRVGS